MGLDQRIGAKFLHPGPGYGGSCFPKDTRALAQIARGKGLVAEITEAAIRVNDRQIDRMVEKARRAIGGSFKGKKVAVLGLSFKPNTDDVRESRSLLLCERLLAEGATVRAHDPVALALGAAEVPGIVVAEDAYDASSGAHLVVLATEWNQYRLLDLARLRECVAHPVFFDMRNVYDPERMAAAGFRYEGVGRGGRIA
jgi:UDPglucose 6-dehydrogenase